MKSLPQNEVKIWASNGRVIGSVENGVFRKSINAKRHFLKYPPAIAFDMQSLSDAEQAGARVIEVLDRESGKTYEAEITTIHRKGFEFNRGYGLQVALPLRYWQTRYGTVEQLPLFGRVT